MFQNNTTRNMKSIKSKLTIVAKNIEASIFVSTTQLLETWNQSNQSLKLLPKHWSFNFCFNNTNRNMKSIKSKLTLPKKNWSLNFCFNNTTTRNMKSIKSNQSLKLLSKTQASIFVSTTIQLETNQSNELQCPLKINYNGRFNCCFPWFPWGCNANGGFKFEICHGLYNPHGWLILTSIHFRGAIGVN